MKRKTAGMITCLMAVSLILGGCQGNPTSNEATGNETEQTSPVEEETSAGKEGTKLVIGVESGSPQIAFYEEQCGEFEEETGIEIEWVEIPHDNMHERFVQEAISKSGAIDIYDADQPWISEFASKGYLEVLGDKLTEEDICCSSSANSELCLWSDQC